MGDGALKIMSAFRDKGIVIAGIFASDDFVRGHSFEGYRVHKLSEIEEMVDDFVVVLAFAAGYQEIVDKIHDIASRHTLYVPDVPVVGRGLFTYEYCLENSEKIQQVYDSLADDYSRKVYANIINFKISGRIEYLSEVTTPKEEIYRKIKSTLTLAHITEILSVSSLSSPEEITTPFMHLNRTARTLKSSQSSLME